MNLYFGSFGNHLVLQNFRIIFDCWKLIIFDWLMLVDDILAEPPNLVLISFSMSMKIKLDKTVQEIIKWRTEVSIRLLSFFVDVIVPDQNNHV